ncbi:Pkinase-domain-containing protein, partial [Hygrophoropsis aurantiaca]
MDDDEFPRLPRKNQGEDDPKMIGLWKVGRTIGKGSSGRVRIARHSKSGKYAAVKIVSKNIVMNSINKLADSAEHMLLSIEREIVIMKLIDHPNIMRLYDVWETSNELYLILEYVEGGELFDYLCDKGRLPTSEALGYFQQIISAIDYCHRFNVAHRDLKPENLLMDENKNIKVADFGMAAWQVGSNNGMLKTACGSPHYAAPEVVMGKEYNGRASDIWSCGVILFALLVGRLPFDDEDLATLLDKVKSGNFDMPSGIDAQAKDLISKMLDKDVDKRITIPEILKHPFYLSESPKPSDRDTPDLDAIARPLTDTDEIDQDIFANLRTLWHGMPDQNIIDSLKSETPNWQKGVYHLLLDYRTRHLENYDEEEEEIQIRHRKRRHDHARKNPQGMKRTTSQATDLGHSSSSLPPRAAPPTPRRAGRISNKNDNELPMHGPEIALHSPSPSRSSFGVHSPLSPSRLLSPNSPLSPVFDSLNLPALTVPDIEDDKMQQFLQKIVQHLNIMETRTAMAGGTPSLGAGLHNPTAPPPTPIGAEFAGQRQHSHDNQLDYAHASLTSNGTHSSKNAFKESPSGWEHLEHGYHSESGQENRYHGMGGPGIIKKSSLRNRNGGNSDKTPLRVQIVEPSPGKLRKKRSGDLSALSSAFSDTSFSLPSTPRRRWLGNVFKFKPASYHLLSIHDTYTTREECRRLLVGLGVRVMLTHAEGSGVLKCRFDEVKDPSGLLAVIKGIRFRVEVHRPNSVQSGAGYQVSLHCIQERGSSSSFQFVYNQLRRIWELDAPRTPVGICSPALTDGGRYTDVIY